MDEFPGKDQRAHAGLSATGLYKSFSTRLRSIQTISNKYGKPLIYPIDDEKSKKVEDLFMKNGYFQSNGEFSAKNSSHQD